MTPAALKSILESKFSLVCFYDLADVFVQHRTAFDIFEQCHKSSFMPDERLIFYTSYAPSQLAIDHLQRAAVQVDVSNFFIEICTPHDITDLLKQSNIKYGNDCETIKWSRYSIESTNPIDASSIHSFDAFCPVPFGGLFVNPDQTAAPCCKFQTVVGSVENSSLIEVFNSDLMRNLRSDVKHGIKNPHCSICWEAEKRGTTSHRINVIHKYKTDCERLWIDDPQIRDLSVSPSNLCNFKCRICTPEFSSSIAVEEIKFSADLEKIQTLKKYNSSVANSNIAQQILQLSTHLKYLHVMGGEPLKWQELIHVLEEFVNNGYSSNIQLEFNTNGSVFDPYMVSLLPNFASVEILISIDDIGARFEIQRGSNWEKILDNICQYKNIISNNITVKIAPTVNIQNLLYLDQLVEFCNHHQFDMVWEYLEYPKYLSIDYITTSTKKIVYKKYINHPNPELQAIAKRVLLSNSVTGQDFINYMVKLDGRRNQNSPEVLKEIFEAMSC